MLRAMPTLLPADLERRLLRKSVGLLTADRDTCADCGRTPLYGELVHRYGSTVVCELCRAMRPDEPDRTDRVRHCEHGLTVKVLRAA
mgnify:CR=1 FL=1|jgi:hypothetical protein